MDIQSTILFLTNQFFSPDEDNGKKLRQLIKYLFGTMEDMTLQLNAYELNFMHWWVNMYYVTHPDLKGHTGAIILIWKACLTSISKNKKIYTTSSTRMDIVGVHGSPPPKYYGQSIFSGTRFST